MWYWGEASRPIHGRLALDLFNYGESIYRDGNTSMLWRFLSLSLSWEHFDNRKIWRELRSLSQIECNLWGNNLSIWFCGRWCIGRRRRRRWRCWTPGAWIILLLRGGGYGLRVAPWSIILIGVFDFSPCFTKSFCKMIVDCNYKMRKMRFTLTDNHRFRVRICLILPVIATELSSSSSLSLVEDLELSFSSSDLLLFFGAKIWE